jgi:hypothetical protein
MYDIKLQTLIRYVFGRAISPAVRRRLPPAATRIRSPLKSRGICGAQSGTGAGFLRIIWFPLPFLIPPNPPYSSIILAWYNRPIGGRCAKWFLFFLLFSTASRTGSWAHPVPSPMNTWRHFLGGKVAGVCSCSLTSI